MFQVFFPAKGEGKYLDGSVLGFPLQKFFRHAKFKTMQSDLGGGAFQHHLLTILTLFSKLVFSEEDFWFSPGIVGWTTFNSADSSQQPDWELVVGKKALMGGPPPLSPPPWLDKTP